jgi:hypothetical protein
MTKSEIIEHQVIIKLLNNKYYMLMLNKHINFANNFLKMILEYLR